MRHISRCRDTIARQLVAKFAFVVVAIVFSAACGSRDGTTNPAQPRATEASAPAPVVLSIPENREAAVRARWESLLREQGIEATPGISQLKLLPLTNTIAALPALPAALRLPKVGDPSASDERRAADERESLRRFLAANALLLGVNIETTTLLSITTPSTNTRRAIYEQRPYIYPLRGGYGRITLDYAFDNRLLNITSTALPEADTATESLRALTARFTADEAIAMLAGKTISPANAVADIRTLPNDAERLRSVLRPIELVIYPVPLASEGGVQRISLRLARELRLTGAPAALLIYVDAISGSVLSAQAETSSDIQMSP